MLVRQNSSKVVICYMDMLVLCGSVVSCCNFCLAICMDGAAGPEVKTALTSKEVMYFSWHVLNAGGQNTPKTPLNSSPTHPISSPYSSAI